MSPTLVILLVGCLVASSCALIGAFLVLRKMALLGDAISHAVLPGIAIAFLISGERSALPMVLGAGIVGIVTVALIELSTRTRRLKEDASIGVVFPALFAFGVILISRYAAQVDLDLDCVLYGEIAYSPWDLLFVDGRPIGPKALWVNGVILALNLTFVIGLYKELKVTTFDPALAAALGFAPTLVHYLLMTLVSVTVVGAFESVGAILVVAMLVVPPATAYLLTERLSAMLALSVALGMISAIAGYGLARWWDASIAGAMATVSGGLFLLTFLLSPRHGLVARLQRHQRLTLAMSEQLLLLHLSHGNGGQSAASVARRFSWGGRRMRRIIDRLTERGWLEVGVTGIALSADGIAAIERSGQLPLRHLPVDEAPEEVGLASEEAGLASEEAGLAGSRGDVDTLANP